MAYSEFNPVGALQVIIAYKNRSYSRKERALDLKGLGLHS
jgi:hypothetical protein